MKDKVRPIYFEFQGYLSQAPELNISSIFENRVWEQHNLLITELQETTGKNYDRYRLHPEALVGRMRIPTQVYRTILGGLISRLHGEYFPDELSPIK